MVGKLVHFILHYLVVSLDCKRKKILKIFSRLKSNRCVNSYIQLISDKVIIDECFYITMYNF